MVKRGEILEAGRLDWNPGSVNLPGLSFPILTSVPLAMKRVAAYRSPLQCLALVKCSVLSDDCYSVVYARVNLCIPQTFVTIVSSISCVFHIYLPSRTRLDFLQYLHSQHQPGPSLLFCVCRMIAKHWINIAIGPVPPRSSDPAGRWISTPVEGNEDVSTVVIHSATL